MNIKEIIKNLLDQAEDRESCADPDDPEDIFRLDARALREAAELLSGMEPPDGPLTVEQLKEIDGEPVWITGVSLSYPNGNWDICDWSNMEIALFPYCSETPDLDLCGKTWFAYRRRPEGDGGHD